MDASMLLGLGSAVASPVIDLLTGASRKQRRAQDAQKSQLQGVLNRINGEMGTSATDSLSYKTGMAGLNKQYDRQMGANNQNAIASGMSDEARLGQMATLNDGINTAQMGVLGQAEQDRRALQGQADQVAGQISALGVERANTGMQNQNTMMQGAMSLVPYLLKRKNKAPSLLGGGSLAGSATTGGNIA